MYSIKRRFRTITAHLDDLIKQAKADANFATPEAFSANYCVAEKMVRRVLMHLMIQDARCKHVATMDAAAKAIQSLSSFKKLDEKWRKHEPKSQSIAAVIGKRAFDVLCESYELRCMLLHGEGHPGVRKLRKKTQELRSLIEEIHSKCGKEYGFSGWKH